MELIVDLLEFAESRADEDLLFRPEAIAEAIDERLKQRDVVKDRVA